MNLVPQFGFLELVLVAVVALIVVGPKDLPKLMREAGKFFAKARAMARDFTNAFDQMAHEAELEDLRKDLRKDIETLKKENPFLDAKGEIENDLASVDKDIRDEMADIESAAAATQSGGEAAPGDPAAQDEPAAQSAAEPAPGTEPAPSSETEPAPAEDRAEPARRGEHATS